MTLKIDKTNVQDTQVICKTYHCEKTINFEIDSKGEITDLDMIISYDEIDDDEKWLQKKTVDTHDVFDSNTENYDFHLTLNDTIDSMLKDHFPDTSQDQRNSLSQQIYDKIEKVIQDEGIYFRS